MLLFKKKKKTLKIITLQTNKKSKKNILETIFF